LRREQSHLFTFLAIKDVEWHNNSAERAIKVLVPIRKNSYGSRTQTGAQAIATLASVMHTAKNNGINFVQFLLEYLSSEDRVKTAQKLFGSGTQEQQKIVPTAKGKPPPTECCTHSLADYSGMRQKQAVEIPITA